MGDGGEEKHWSHCESAALLHIDFKLILPVFQLESRKILCVVVRKAQKREGHRHRSVQLISGDKTSRSLKEEALQMALQLLTSSYRKAGGSKNCLSVYSSAKKSDFYNASNSGCP